MIGVLLLLPAVIATANDAFYNVRDGPQYFKDFIQDYHKVYKSEEEKALRYNIFLKNLDEINDMNKRNRHAKFGINKLTDLTLDEFLTQYAGSKNDLNSEERTSVHQELDENTKSVEIPPQFDWRTKNVITSVKDQGACGAAWAFSVTGLIESLFAMKTNQIIELSAQQLIDCETLSEGCAGGDPVIAAIYFKRLGAMSHENYPYEAKDGICRYDHEKVTVNVTDFRLVRRNEKIIAEKLYQNGPLVVDMGATVLKSYVGGIISGESCMDTDFSHAALLVGYGIENGLSYWLMKNSWGETWGEQGYFRIHRGVHCLNFAAWPPVSVVIV